MELRSGHGHWYFGDGFEGCWHWLVRLGVQQYHRPANGTVKIAIVVAVSAVGLALDAFSARLTKMNAMGSPVQMNITFSRTLARSQLPYCTLFFERVFFKRAVYDANLWQ